MKRALISHAALDSVALVERAGPYLERTIDATWMRRLDAHADVLLETALHLEGHAAAVYAAALWPWCLERGHYGAALDMLIYSQAPCADAVSLRVRARACLGMGVLWQREQNFVQAETYLQIALSVCLLLDDDFLLGLAHHYLGLLYRRTARYDEAAAHHHTSLDIWRCANDPWGVATALAALAALLTKQGDLDAVRTQSARGSAA